MSDKSSIQWTDATWNPLRGTKGKWHCVRVSPGCQRCYAATMNRRFKGPDYVVGADTPRLDEKALLLPLKWKKPRRIFVCSMTDLFMDEHTDEMIDRVFAVMALAPQHTFQVLTKRAKRMREWFCGKVALEDRKEKVQSTAAHMGNIVWDSRGSDPNLYPHGTRQRVENRRAWKGWPLPNVWLGVSAENQERADERIPDLLATPAAVRFVSAEPLLGPIRFTALSMPGAPEGLNAFRRAIPGLPTVNWVIVGGESGPGARPLSVSWVRGIQGQCRRFAVPLFNKQLGANVRDRNDAGFDGEPGDAWCIHDEWRVENLTGPSCQGDPVRVHLKDRKGGSMEEWPEDLRVREMPA